MAGPKLPVDTLRDGRAGPRPSTSSSSTAKKTKPAGSTAKKNPSKPAKSTNTKIPAPPQKEAAPLKAKKAVPSAPKATSPPTSTLLSTSASRKQALEKKLDANNKVIADLRRTNQTLKKSFLEKASVLDEIKHLDNLNDRLTKQHRTAVSDNENLKAKLEKEQKRYLGVAEQRLMAHQCLQNIYKMMTDKNCKCVDPTNNKKKRLIEVVHGIQLDFHGKAAVILEALEAQEGNFLPPQQKVADSQKVIADLKQENEQLQKEIAACTNAAAATPRGSRADAMASERQRAVVENHNAQLEDSTGKYEKQNQLLKQDVASRRAYLEGEQTMKGGFETAIAQVLKLMQDNCDDAALKESIMARELTYKMSLA